MSEERDLVVTVPKAIWPEWIAEGELPGDPPAGLEWHFNMGGPRPELKPGARIYVVAHGRLRGYAPLVRLENGRVWAPGDRDPYGWALVRHGGAVACTISEPIRGFRGWKYRWWPRDQEVPFPDWKTAGVAW